VTDTEIGVRPAHWTAVRATTGRCHDAEKSHA